ncbi:MAG: hypothetical protein KKC18_02870, partial [Chloroflexi bacterium]|nr:hypothetical protein [Chloroflexota bacterium]
QRTFSRSIVHLLETSYALLGSCRVLELIARDVEASMVTATVCAGRVLMRDQRLLTLDEEAITARSRELATQVWRRISEQ